MDANTHAQELIFSDIIQRVVAYEDPPFRPDLTRVDVRPEFVDLIVDCWCDDAEERPHFFRIVERLKKISGRSVVLQVIVELLDTTLPLLGCDGDWVGVVSNCTVGLFGGKTNFDTVTCTPSRIPFLFLGGRGADFVLDDASCNGHWTLDNVHVSFIVSFSSIFSTG